YRPAQRHRHIRGDRLSHRPGRCRRLCGQRPGGHASAAHPRVCLPAGPAGGFSCQCAHRPARGKACPQSADRRVEENFCTAADRDGDKDAAEPVSDMKFTLLTHEKEFAKRSNTGRLVLDVLGGAAEQLQWDRMNPPAGLLEEIEAGGVALVYPGAADENDGDLSGITRFILIDGTWHEARKIHQRSPYLQKVRRIGLTPTGKSRYNLRKNQKEA